MRPLPASFIATLLFTAGCLRPDLPPAAPRPASAARVHVAEVKLTAGPRLTEASGTVRAVNRAAVAPQVMGTIASLPVALGQVIRQGEVLARISPAESDARLAQARAQLAATRRDLARETELAAQGASATEAVRSLQDRLTGAEALVREAEVQRSYTEIRAPFDGLVSRRLAETGDLAVAGRPILEVEDPSRLEIEAGIPESAADVLRPGATLTCEAGPVRVAATVREVAPGADAATRTITVRIDVPAGTALRTGQFVLVQVPVGQRTALTLPAAAVSRQGQMERVFIVGGDGLAVLRLVRTAPVGPANLEVLAGLEAGERVVVDPPAGLREGTRLEILP